LYLCGGVLRRLVVVLATASQACGCGVVWDSGGQRHASGIGYVSWPIAKTERSAAVYGNDLVGVALMATKTSTGLTVGYSSERLIVLNVDNYVPPDCLHCGVANSAPRRGTLDDVGDKQCCGVVWDSGGQRHALGIGYVSWPVAKEGQSAIVYGNDLVGAALMATKTSTGLMVGYSSERLVVLNGDNYVTLSCLHCDLASSAPRGGTLDDAGDKQ
jgi:hypothetical protein